MEDDTPQLYMQPLCISHGRISYCIQPVQGLVQWQPNP